MHKPQQDLLVIYHVHSHWKQKVDEISPQPRQPASQDWMSVTAGTSIKITKKQRNAAKNRIKMKSEYKQLIPEDFHQGSRVWIYQSNRLFSISEALDIEEMLNDFTENWNSHGAKVKGYANLLFGQFIVLMADESQAGVSGCSTDSSVRLIKAIEQKFSVELFNRQNLAFLINDKIQTLPLTQVKYALENNFITPDTIYFNNLVLNKEELLNNWMIPVKESWLARKFNISVNV